MKKKRVCLLISILMILLLFGCTDSNKVFEGETNTKDINTSDTYTDEALALAIRDRQYLFSTAEEAEKYNRSLFASELGEKTKQAMIELAGTDDPIEYLNNTDNLFLYTGFQDYYEKKVSKEQGANFKFLMSELTIDEIIDNKVMTQSIDLLDNKSINECKYESIYKKLKYRNSRTGTKDDLLESSISLEGEIMDFEKSSQYKLDNPPLYETMVSVCKLKDWTGGEAEELDRSLKNQLILNTLFNEIRSYDERNITVILSKDYNGFILISNYAADKYEEAFRQVEASLLNS